MTMGRPPFRRLSAGDGTQSRGVSIVERTRIALAVHQVLIDKLLADHAAVLSSQEIAAAFTLEPR